jgi:signal transduction histidine kinase
MRRLSVPPLDVAVAAGCLAGAVAELALADYAWAPGGRAPQAIGAAISCLALLARRRAPLVCVATFVAAQLFTSAVAEPPQLLSIGVAYVLVAYAIGAELDGRSRIAAAVVLVATGVLRDLDDPQHAGDPLIDPLFLLLAMAAGGVVRRRQRQVDHVAKVAADRAQDALRQERARIARELHDVIAHGVSVMVVQADAARHTSAPQDRETRAALAAIERTGRESMRELRRLLGLLRSDAEDSELSPHPGVADLPELAQSLRHAGLPVDLRVEGDRVALPPGPDLAAYRIVQEALTNALRHAGPARATVRVTYAPHSLTLEVADTGNRNGNGGPSPGAGHGMIAMRERARLYGGTFAAGRGEHGFVVTATLPLDPD